MIRMDKFVVQGGNPLKGSVQVSGSKNAVLPIMAATLLADGVYEIENVPRLRDVQTMLKMLHSLGLEAEQNGHALRIRGVPCNAFEAPYDLVKTMRASVYVLGPLLARYGQARVSLPGGCAWGPRPVNLHIEGMQKLGAKIEIRNGYIHARAARLRGAEIVFDIPSVGATGNILMASVLAKGRSTIENAAREPEIESLALFLNDMGAKINGIGSHRLEIEGVDTLHPARTAVIPDRIEAGTFLIAAHMTGGNIRLTHVEPAHLESVIRKLSESGAVIETDTGAIQLKSHGKISPVNITTAVYPGFPTDMQAQWMALMTRSNGVSVIRDDIYEDRFTHVAELKRLGADITLDHNIAVVNGKKRISGAPVMSTDLRASASLIIAGLIAEGETHISRVYHIDRGYEKIEMKLKKLGAEIERTKEVLVI